MNTWIWISDCIAYLFDLILFFLVFVVSPRIRWREIRDGSLSQYEMAMPPAKVLLKSEAEFLYRHQQDAAAHTDANVRQLLALTSFLSTVAVGFVAYLSDSIPPLIFCPLFASIFICLELLSVRVESVPTFSTAKYNAEWEWAHDLAVARRNNRAVHAYHVQLYRAALNWFLIAFVIAFLAIIRAQMTSFESDLQSNTRAQTPIIVSGAWPAPQFPANHK